MAQFAPIIVILAVVWFVYRALTRNPNKPAPPADPYALTIPCPYCGKTTTVNESWLKAHDKFLCPACGQSTNLIKSAVDGTESPSAIMSPSARAQSARFAAANTYKPTPGEIDAAVKHALKQAERAQTRTVTRNALKPITKALLVKLDTDGMKPETVAALEALEIKPSTPGYISVANVTRFDRSRQHAAIGDFILPCPHCERCQTVSSDWIRDNDVLRCQGCGRRVQLYRTVSARRVKFAIISERAALDQTVVEKQPEPEDAHDEAAHLPPIAPPAHHTGKLQTLVRGINTHVQFIYTGGSHPGQVRRAVIASACGYIQDDGGFDVTVLRCICDISKDWRAFQIARMQDFADLETGELIADPKAWITDKLNQMA